MNVVILQFFLEGQAAFQAIMTEKAARHIMDQWLKGQLQKGVIGDMSPPAPGNPWTLDVKRIQAMHLVYPNAQNQQGGLQVGRYGPGVSGLN